MTSLFFKNINIHIKLTKPINNLYYLFSYLIRTLIILNLLNNLYTENSRNIIYAINATN
jgi:hypothetical protein